VKGHRPNHILHLILSIITLGIWLIVWVLVGLFGGETRRTITVQPDGGVVGEPGAGTWKYENGRVDATRRLLPQRWRTSPACSAFLQGSRLCEPALLLDDQRGALLEPVLEFTHGDKLQSSAPNPTQLWTDVLVEEVTTAPKSSSRLTRFRASRPVSARPEPRRLSIQPPDSERCGFFSRRRGNLGGRPI
jgi:hypothetical protein